MREDLVASPTAASAGPASVGPMPPVGFCPAASSPNQTEAERVATQAAIQAIQGGSYWTKYRHFPLT